jgi:hypothetical protein
MPTLHILNKTENLKYLIDRVIKWKLLTQPYSETGLIAYIMIAIDFFFGPGYILKIPKIWKSAFFDTPFFYERKVM